MGVPFGDLVNLNPKSININQLYSSFHLKAKKEKKNKWSMQKRPCINFNLWTSTCITIAKLAKSKLLLYYGYTWSRYRKSRQEAQHTWLWLVTWCRTASAWDSSHSWLLIHWHKIMPCSLPSFRIQQQILKVGTRKITGGATYCKFSLLSLAQQQLLVFSQSGKSKTRNRM